MIGRARGRARWRGCRGRGPGSGRRRSRGQRCVRVRGQVAEVRARSARHNRRVSRASARGSGSHLTRSRRSRTAVMTPHPLETLAAGIAAREAAIAACCLPRKQNGKRLQPLPLGAHEAMRPKMAGLKTMNAAKAAAEERNSTGSEAAAAEAAERVDLATGVATSTALPEILDTSRTVPSTSTPEGVVRASEGRGFTAAAAACAREVPGCFGLVVLTKMERGRTAGLEAGGEGRDALLDDL